MESFLVSDSVSKLPSGSVAEKNVMVDIPSEQQPEAETHLRDAPKNLYDLPDKSEEIDPVKGTEEKSALGVFIPPNDETILPSDDEPTSLSVSEESSADGKDVHESLMRKTEGAKTNEQPLENHEKRLSLQGYANDIFAQSPPKAEGILGREEGRLTPKESLSSSSLNTEEENVELSAEVNSGISPGEVSCIMDEGPLEGALEGILGREEGRLTPKESLSSSSLNTEEENVELSAEVNSGISPGEVSCIMDEGPLEGALPSTFSEETTSRIGAKVIKSTTDLVLVLKILLVF